jgi:hypothetical protein
LLSSQVTSKQYQNKRAAAVVGSMHGVLKYFFKHPEASIKMGPKKKGTKKKVGKKAGGTKGPTKKKKKKGSHRH